MKNKIKELFSEAKVMDLAVGELDNKLFKELKLKKDSTLFAVSVCPDELNRSFTVEVQKNFGNYFNMGGLAGYPFTGVTGFNAFADHIPDGGNAVIMFGPHTGVYQAEWGAIKRPGQSRVTSCCGSLIGAHMAVKDGSKPSGAVNNFQQAQVQQMIQNGLSNVKEPATQKHLTDIILKNSYAFVLEQAVRIKEQFNLAKVVLVGMVIINTPSDLPDYLSVEIVEAL